MLRPRPRRVTCAYAAYDTLRIETDAHVHRLALSPAAEAREAQGRSAARSAHPEIEALLVPEEAYRSWGFEIRRSPRWIPFVDPAAALPAAARVLDAFRRRGSVRRSSLGAGVPEILTGLDVVARAAGEEVAAAWRDRARKALDMDLRIGHSHGDFHFRNLLRDPDGGDRIIDLDRFRPRGIQSLDALFFAVEAEAALTGDPWHRALARLHLEGWSGGICASLVEEFVDLDSTGAAVVFLLDRIGQEAAFDLVNSEYLRTIREEVIPRF